MTALLEVEGLSKQFAGLSALTGVGFRIDEGEIVGLIGPNGAGKTTLFNVISGELLPTAGEVAYEGRSLLGLKPHQVVRRGVARTFQLMRPFASQSVHANVSTAIMARGAAMDDARSRAGAIVERVGLQQWEHHPAGELSTAGLKRLEFARALALSPRLLLLDEVMAGLVPTERRPVIDLSRELRDEGITILLVEHVMSAVLELSDRLMVLHHGQLLADGPPAEVTADRAVVEAYLGEEAVE